MLLLFLLMHVVRPGGVPAPPVHPSSSTALAAPPDWLLPLRPSGPQAENVLLQRLPAATPDHPHGFIAKIADFGLAQVRGGGARAGQMPALASPLPRCPLCSIPCPLPPKRAARPWPPLP